MKGQKKQLGIRKIILYKLLPFEFFTNTLFGFTQHAKYFWQESYEKQLFLVVLQFQLLYINLHSSSLVSAVQTENVLFSENLLYFFTSQFACTSCLLKSWLGLP